MNRTITSVVNHRRLPANGRAGVARRPIDRSRLDAEQTPIFYALMCGGWSDRQRQSNRQAPGAVRPPRTRHAGPDPLWAAFERDPLSAPVPGAAPPGVRGRHGLPPSAAGRHPHAVSARSAARRPVAGPAFNGRPRIPDTGRFIASPPAFSSDAATGGLPAAPGDTARWPAPSAAGRTGWRSTAHRSGPIGSAAVRSGGFAGPRPAAMPGRSLGLPPASGPVGIPGFPPPAPRHPLDRTAGSTVLTRAAARLGQR